MADSISLQVKAGDVGEQHGEPQTENSIKARLSETTGNTAASSQLWKVWLPFYLSVLSRCSVRADSRPSPDGGDGSLILVRAGSSLTQHPVPQHSALLTHRDPLPAKDRAQHVDN